MSEPRSYFVYMMSSFSKVLYIGVTGDLEGRVGQHKSAKTDGFTKRYNCFNLVYFEEFDEYRASHFTRETAKKLVKV